MSPLSQTSLNELVTVYCEINSEDTLLLIVSPETAALCVDAISDTARSIGASIAVRHSTVGFESLSSNISQSSVVLFFGATEKYVQPTHNRYNKKQ